MERQRNGETEKWRDREMERQRDREMKRMRDYIGKSSEIENRENERQ